MMTLDDWRKWADDHGYIHCICQRCGQHFWTDSHPECPVCGPEEEEIEE